MFCAYSQVSSSAVGDSGGPFICEDNGFAIIHGIHRGKWIHADKRSVLEIYVFKHIEFIKKYMKQFPAPCCWMSGFSFSNGINFVLDN